MYSKPSTSNELSSSLKNLRRLIEARLQAVLSKNMYSEQGLEALIRPPLGQVCHSLMVVSYCVPGSAQRHAASEIASHTLRAGIDCITRPSVRAFKSQLPSSFNALKNVLGIRTELFEF